MLSESPFAIVERKVASLSPEVADKVVRHCFALFCCNCAYSERVELSESVIVLNCHFRNKGLVQIFKKKIAFVLETLN